MRIATAWLAGVVLPGAVLAQLPPRAVQLDPTLAAFRVVKWAQSGATAAFVLDPGVPDGFASTSGLESWFQ